MPLSSVSVWIQVTTLSILTALLCYCACDRSRNSHIASLAFNVTCKLFSTTFLVSLLS